MPDRIFADQASRFRELGFYSRPIASGTKACKIKGWQTPDPELDPSVLQSWLKTHATSGIGLLLGSPFPDGTVLGAVDIDRDDYMRITEHLLGGLVCGRIGARGAAYFVRIRGNGRYREFKIKGKVNSATDKIGELLCDRRLAVIPPTIHPVTNKPYRWIGTPLHELDFADLPILEMPE